MDNHRTERILLRVPSDLRYGEAARAMLDILTKRLEAETGTSGLNAQVISAFAEAFNNVVWHGYKGDRDGDVEIEITISPSSLKLSLADRGEGFDIDSVEEPDLTTLPERGLGLLIIRSMMSRVEYSRDEEGDRNVFTMIKDFDRPLVLTGERQVEV